MSQESEPTQTSAVSQTEPEQPERIAKKGCIEAVRDGSNFKLVKVDNTCSCPINLSQPFSAKDAMSLSRLLHNVATAGESGV